MTTTSQSGYLPAEALSACPRPALADRKTDCTTFVTGASARDFLADGGRAVVCVTDCRNEAGDDGVMSRSKRPQTGIPAGGQGCVLFDALATFDFSVIGGASARGTTGRRAPGSTRCGAAGRAWLRRVGDWFTAHLAVSGGVRVCHVPRDIRVPRARRHRGYQLAFAVTRTRRRRGPRSGRRTRASDRQLRRGAASNAPVAPTPELIRRHRRGGSAELAEKRKPAQHARYNLL